MTKWSRALGVFPEDLGSIPSTCMVTHSFVTLVPGYLMPSSGFCGHKAGMWSSGVNVHNINYKKQRFRDWRNGLVIKSVCCSCRAPGFSSQCPCGGSQPSLSFQEHSGNISGNLFPPSDLCKHYACIHVGKMRKMK